MEVAVSQIRPKFDEVCENKQASPHITLMMHIFLLFPQQIKLQVLQKYL